MTEDVIKNPSRREAWFLASRPKTLILSLVPILVGTALGLKYATHLNILLFFSALFSSFFIQIAVNLLNDAIDSKKGADTSERLGPERATHQGWLTYNEVLRGGLTCLFLACIVGIPMVIFGGGYFLVLIIASCACAYCYTGGPYPLSYNGWGEVFVVAFYGLFGTMAGFYLQAHQLNTEVFLAGLQIGLLAAAVNAINNLRDIHTDAKVNKRTWAVRFGVDAARLEITFLILAPYFLSILWADFGYLRAGLLSFVTLPLGFTLVRCIWFYEPSKKYNSFLAMAALLTFLFSLFLSIGFWI